MRDFLSYLADFGDSAVLIAIVFSSAFFLLYRKHYNSAMALVTTLLVSAGIIATLKLIFISCGHNFLNIHSPSGHAALSISVYGMFGLVFYRHLPGLFRIFVSAGFLALGFIIAISRVIMNLHTLNEVILGGSVGILVMGFFWYMCLHRQPFAVPDNQLRKKTALGVALIIIAVASLVHGTRLPAEPFMQSKAKKIQSKIEFCHF